MDYKRLFNLKFKNITLIYEGSSVKEEQSYHDAQNIDIFEKNSPGNFSKLLVSIGELLEKIEEVKLIEIRNHKLIQNEVDTLMEILRNPKSQNIQELKLVNVKYGDGITQNDFVSNISQNQNRYIYSISSYFIMCNIIII